MDRFPRVQEIVLPIIRKAIPHATATSWVPDIDYRTYPIVNVRRLGGPRDRSQPTMMDHPVIEMTVYHDEGLPEAEELYNEALSALYAAQKEQTMVDKGYLSYVRETMGMTQFSSPFQDTYRVQGLIQLGIRPPRKDFSHDER